MTVRVGVWGAGRHAQRKLLPAIAAMPELELRGAVTRDATALLADPDIDAILVATPTGLHHEHGLRVLAAGKHLWCEKALSPRAGELVAYARARDLAVCEAFMYAYHPQVERVRELVAEPSFGGVVSLTCRFGIPHQDRAGYRYRADLGGGALLDVGCYAIHAAMTVLGAPLEVVSSRVVRPPDEPVDTLGEAILTRADGARAHLEWGYGVAYRNELFVWGRGASLTADKVFSKPPDHVATIELGGETGDLRRIDVPPADAFQRMLARFAAATRDPAERAAQWKLAEDQGRHLASVINASSADDPKSVRPG